MPIRERNPAQPESGHQRAQAETMALNMVRFLMGDDDRSGGFFDTTGLAPDDLRTGLQDAAFLGGVMDYLLGREDILIEFCQEAGIDPMEPLRLRAALP